MVSETMVTDMPVCGQHSHTVVSDFEGISALLKSAFLLILNVRNVEADTLLGLCLENNC